MRKRLCAISLLGLVAASSASAQTPLAEPQDKPRVQPTKPRVGEGDMKPANASSGSSALRATTPEDASAAHEREDDERRATESKRKMKNRPGYREEVPMPRA